MLNEEKFLKIISDNIGFQVTLGFRDDVDHFLGGRGSKVWYYIQKKKTADYYVGTLTGGVWEDVHYVLKKKILTSEPAPSGTAIGLILSELSIGQEEIEKDGRKPIAVKVYELPCSHYSFAFGERAYQISDDYGITVSYSNLKDEEAGFRLRTLIVGEDIKIPEEL